MDIIFMDIIFMGSWIACGPALYNMEVRRAKGKQRAVAGSFYLLALSANG